MTTALDSFDASPQGAFVESPQDGRNDPASSGACALEVMIYEREKAAGDDTEWGASDSYVVGDIRDIDATISSEMLGPYYRCIAAHDATVGNWKPESTTQNWELYWERAKLSVDKAIVGVDTGNKKFTIAGQHSENSEIQATDIVTVKDSTGNDGDYTVNTATEAGGTTIVTVDEAISDPSVDGNLVCLQQARDKINDMAVKYLDESGGDYTGGASAPTLYANTVADAGRTEQALADVITPWTDTVISVSTADQTQYDGTDLDNGTHAGAISAAEADWATLVGTVPCEAYCLVGLAYSVYDAAIGGGAGLYKITTLTILLRRKVRILAKNLVNDNQFVFGTSVKTFGKQGFTVPDEDQYGFVLTESAWTTAATFDTEILTLTGSPWASPVWPADPPSSNHEVIGWQFTDERRVTEWDFQCLTLES